MIEDEEEDEDDLVAHGHESRSCVKRRGYVFIESATSSTMLFTSIPSS